MGRAAPAASRALDILELFLDQPVLSAADVVSRLGLPRTTVHELLGTLGVRAEPARRTPTPHDSVSIISNVEIKSSMGTRRNRNAARTRTEPGR